jgi:uncharacterized protein
MMPIRRDVHCSLPAERIRDWHSKGSPVSHFFNALSVFFPIGERFFIASVRNYRDQVTDPQLREAVTAFIGQEAMHGREHENYNRLLQDSGMPVSVLERIVAFALGAAQKLTPKSWQLATTLALEHHTAILADLLLSRPELLRDSEPAFARLWRWHALEETEHKAVAFDVWNGAVGPDRAHHLIRGVTMATTTLAFWGMVAAFSVCMIETDARTRRQPRGYPVLADFLLGAEGMYRKSLPAWLAYFRRSFHPWQHDNRHLLAQVDSVIGSAEGGLVMGRAA